MLKTLGTSTATIAIAAFLAVPAYAQETQTQDAVDVDSNAVSLDDKGVSTDKVLISYLPPLELADTVLAPLDMAQVTGPDEASGAAVIEVASDKAAADDVVLAKRPAALAIAANEQVTLINAALAAPQIDMSGSALAEVSLALASDARAQFTDAASSGRLVPLSFNPLYGDINPFYGDISPFYGNIGAFWGDISPFYGDISPFYGDISPFYGDIGAFWGDIDAFYGNIDAFSAAHLDSLGVFWSSAGTLMSTVDSDWGQLEAGKTGFGLLKQDPLAANVQAQLLKLVALSEAQFGKAYARKTGKSLSNDFAADLFARHGIDLNDTSTLVGKNGYERAAFFLDWHDSLNVYSGIDAIDHWMSAINWNPAITQVQGEGKGTVIGVIDGSFASDADLGNNVIWTGGHSTAVGGHGAGVASLIAGAHDGEGVMGIAPQVHIASYNPFDSNGTASYSDVANGLIQLFSLKRYDLNETGQVSIINMSLGEKGWVLSQDMADVLTHAKVRTEHSKTVFVVAAGNDGITQTQDVELADAHKLGLILVGSIDPFGEISSFSNRPGSAALLSNGVRQQGSELFRRFIVAPGEMLLMSDGQGGVTRASGTSFAAPLVSGAVSLLHDRWPWLVKNPLATTEIIFRSAQDLGAPGPDEVYGWGLLDVAASQAPLDFNNTSFNLYVRSGSKFKSQSLAASDVLAGGLPSWWQTSEVFFTMFEKVAGTERDFTVPASALTFGSTTDVLGRGQLKFQDFINVRFSRWIKSQGKNKNGGKNGFSEVQSDGAQLPGDWSLRFDAMMPGITPEGSWQPTHSAAQMTAPGGEFSLTLGHGNGAMALGGYRFGVMTDHDPFTGGVNPVLGFASGEVFAALDYKIAEGTTLKFGFSENREEWDEIGETTQENLMNRRQLGDRPATAFTFDLEQRVSDAFSLNAQYTKLREDNALLGARTGVDALLGNGSHTQALTVSASLDIGKGMSFDLSATGARTKTADGQLFYTGENAVKSSAAQFTATKRGLFAGSDSLRLTLAQPLKIEDGELEFSSDQIVDRITGERGIVTQTIGVQNKRRITGEAVYAMPLSNTSDFGLFGRYVSAGELGDPENYVLGGNFNLRF